MEELQDLGAFLRGLTLAEYIKVFGSYWNREQHKYVNFTLWPGQKDVCDRIDGKDGIKAKVILPKARQLGASEMAAERACKYILQNPNVEGIIISKTEPDAQYFLEKRIKTKLQNLPQIDGIEYPAIIAESKQYVKLSNGSTITSLPASNRAGASRTVDFIIFDEAGGIDKQPNADFAEMYRNVVPTIEKAGKYGWMMIIGTSEPGSYYNDLVKKVLKKENNSIHLEFLPWYTDPARTPEWKAETLREFPSEADFKTQYPETIDDFFAVKEGLVLPNFDNKEGGRHVKSMEETASCRIITGYDHGYRHPAVWLLAYYDPYKDHLHIAKERYWWEVPVEMIAPQIRLEQQELKRVIWKSIADTAIFGNTGVRSVAEHFRTYGVRFTKSEKHMGLAGENGSLTLLSARFTHGTITIDPSCVNLIEQLSIWRWNDKVKGEKPMDVDDDGPDVLRYICAELRKQKKESPATPLQAWSKESIKRAQQVQRFFSRSPMDTSEEPESIPTSWQYL